MRRRKDFSAPMSSVLMSSPSTRICPLVGSIRRIAIMPVVLLPEPELADEADDLVARQHEAHLAHGVDVDLAVRRCGRAASA